ncbi:MAG TPA: serine/threonine-protein kinase [Gemmata sp.]|nr:serine/threonine-protein kinase [Gemmata sp.]
MERLDDLLLEWEDRRDRGETVGPESLCPDDTRLQRELAGRIRLLEAYDALMSPAGIGVHAVVPSSVGKYSVLDILGSGGMGVVYRAQDPVLHRTVAIKMIQPRHVALSGERAKARFAREGQALARLDHPSIVRVYEADVRDGPPYLVMEFVRGGSLASHRERLTAAGSRLILPLMEKVARAVQYAHAQGVLHRDLKPANILLGENDEPRVADFGLAALLNNHAADFGEGIGSPAGNRTDVSVLTTDAALPGTPAYKAPEQFDPAYGKLGPATDVWAMGVILYELLVGKRPFFETAEANLADVVINSPAPRPAKVSKEVVAVISRCLEKQPEKRFQSAGELAHALHRLQGLSRRTMNQRALLAGGALLATGVPIGFLASDPYRRFRWRTLGLVQSVRARKKVDLIEHGGSMPPYYLRSGEEVTQIAMSPEGLVVRSPTYSIVELLPELPDGECHVELEMRHDSSEFRPGGEGSVGLFFAAARVYRDDLIHHFLGYTFFDEFQTIPEVAIAAKWYQVPTPSSEAIARRRGPFYGSNSKTSIEMVPAPKPFRALSLTISPNSATLTWHGPPQRELGPYSEADTKQNLELIDKELFDHKLPEISPALAADYKPRLGVFVSGGKITVRKLRITP